MLGKGRRIAIQAVSENAEQDGAVRLTGECTRLKLINDRTRRMQQAMKERRSAYRYPLRFGMEYRIFGKSHSIAAGFGEILNMSSRGLLVNVDDEVSKGQLVEVSIDWRIYPNRPPVADLIVLGRVVRSSPGGSAIRILRYGFYPRREKVSELALSGNAAFSD